MPCLSNPCNYGGSCIQGPGLGEFSCQCGIEITVLPFIDNTCNVGKYNSHLLKTSTQTAGENMGDRENMGDSWSHGIKIEN